MTLIRARNSGMLDEIPGLVYARSDRADVAEELVDTGIQRLVSDLDELPHPVDGYRLLEPPSSRATLASEALPANKVRRYSRVGSLVLTFGCKFACPYCPIPAYNQRQHRTKSGDRIADEMIRIYKEYGIRHFFGADDNFFNDKKRTVGILQSLARIEVDGAPIRKKMRWGTEVTVHDTLQMRDHLPLARKAGIRALWIGVEDMTATLIKKGQSVSKTIEAFSRLRNHGICPMPMMMHHDKQPLYTPGRPYGLLNQAKLLRKVGATSLQVLMMTPAIGSKSYEDTFKSGLVYDSVGGKRVEPYMLDANYVIASEHARPWVKQLNIMAAYLYFYNPLRFLIALVRPKSKLYLADAGMQALGMWGLSQTVRRTLGWAWRLMCGNIKRRTRPPASPIPIRSSGGGATTHAIPGTPNSGLVQSDTKMSAASAKQVEVRAPIVTAANTQADSP